MERLPWLRSLDGAHWDAGVKPSEGPGASGAFWEEMREEREERKRRQMRERGDRRDQREIEEEKEEKLLEELIQLL